MKLLKIDHGLLKKFNKFLSESLQCLIDYPVNNAIYNLLIALATIILVKVELDFFKKLIIVF